MFNTENIIQKKYELKNPGLINIIFGNFDENIKIIENKFDVRIVSRDDGIKIIGSERNVNKSFHILTRLADLAESENEVTTQNVSYLISISDEENDYSNGVDNPVDCICVTAKGNKIKSKTFGQKKYVEAIKNNTIVFGIGPAGTGKTFLAVAMAVKAFREKKTGRIILTRPAVEAGEKLGFLPGDLQNKVDPYLRPLYDALYETMGLDSYNRQIERGVIEIVPLAYMRGRTLDDSFIILDEAQNTTPEQMKMFLTRIGFGSMAVITGDITQIDLPKDKKSGLKEIVKVLKNIDGIEFVYFDEKDVVRHRLVQKIIKAYEKYENKKTNSKK